MSVVNVYLFAVNIVLYVLNADLSVVIVNGDLSVLNVYLSIVNILIKTQGSLSNADMSSNFVYNKCRMLLLCLRVLQQFL